MRTGTGLRVPVGVYLVGLLFVVAPVANILVSFAYSGVTQWYRPGRFAGLVGTISLVDWIWLAGTFLSGAALFLRHKSAWLIAVASLVVVLMLNAYRALSLEPSAANVDLVRTQIVFSVAVTLSILVIGFYARYPYLDRRQRWAFPTAQRFRLSEPVVVHAVHDLPGTTESVSSTGMFIRLSGPAAPLKRGSELTLTVPGMPALGIVNARVVEHDRDVLRLTFTHTGWGFRGTVEGWLRSGMAEGAGAQRAAMPAEAVSMSTTDRSGANRSS